MLPNTRPLALPLVAFALLVASCAPGRTARGADAPTPARADAEIRATLQQMADAWNGADLAAHVAPYLDSASFMTGNGPVRGRDRTEASLRRAFWRDGRPVQTLRFERVDVRPLGVDHALTTGRFVLEGGAAPKAGWFTLVWARGAGGWRIVHDHSG